MSREMKDSGITYLGMIPKSWNIFRIKNGFECKKQIVGEKWNNTQLLSLTTNGVKEKNIDNPNGKLPESFETYQLVNKNNIVMCLFDLDCSAVFSGISNYNGMISPAYKILNCKESINPRFAGYFFNYIGYDRKYTHYSKNIRYTLSYEEFSFLPMIFPPVEEQIKISNYLDNKCAIIDEQIENNKKSIELLEVYKKCLIQNKLEKYGANKIKIKYLLAEGKEGIKCGPFGSSLTGKTLDSSNYKIYSQANLISNNFEIFRNCVSKETYENLSNYIVLPNDILLSMMGTIGKCKIIPTNISPGIMDSHIIKVRLNNKIIPDFFELIYDKDTSNYIFEQLLYESKGSIMDGLNTHIVKNLFFPYFSLAEQRKFVKEVKKQFILINKVIDYRKQIIEKLEEYKKSLIYEAVTGKIEV